MLYASCRRFPGYQTLQDRLLTGGVFLGEDWECFFDPLGLDWAASTYGIQVYPFDCYLNWYFQIFVSSK